MKPALTMVFSKPLYCLLAGTIASVMFAVALWLPNFALIIQVMSDVEMTALGVALLMFNLLGSISTSFTPASALLLALTASLTGVYVTLVIYLVRYRTSAKAAYGTGLIGLLSGMIGIGCVACGSLLLTSLLSFATATAVLGVLPLKGLEFSILGIVLLIISIIIVLRAIQKPNMCKL